MGEMSLNAHERDVENARAKLTRDLAVLCSPRTMAGFTEGLKQEALETRDAFWEALKARAAANPAAMMAIAAGLGWRLMSRPPIASALIGLGLFSLWRTSAQPLDTGSSFIQQSTRSLRTQGEDFAAAASDLAVQAKDAVAAKGGEAWDAAKVNMQTWAEAAGEGLDKAGAQAKSVGNAVLDNLRRQRRDLRDEISEVTSTAREAFREEDTRNTLLMGLAGVAVAAAVGIACQKRMRDTAEI
jgi:hypothetical protein